MLRTAVPALQLRVANNRFQRVLALRTNRNKRHRYGEFIAEGVRPVNHAVRAGWEIRSLWFDAERELSDWARNHLESAVPGDRVAASADLFRQLTDRAEPPELLAVVAIPRGGLERLPVEPGVCVLVLDRPGSPGNLGSLVRSADVLGAAGVVVAGHAADIYDPLTVRASLGSLFAIPVVAAESPGPILEWVSEARRQLGAMTVVALDPDPSAAPLATIDLRGPVTLVVGNETFGLSAAWKAAAGHLAHIPMAGQGDSLNAAVSGSIAIYEVFRQRT